MAIDWNKDYYSVLQVPRFSSSAEIKASYRSLAKKFHPDMNPGNRSAEEKFKEINSAYDILSDDQNKLIYDNKLRNPSSFQQEQFRSQQRSQYQQYQQTQYEEFLKQQQRAKDSQGRGRQNERQLNYDISPWRIVFIVMIIINLLRMCTHRSLIP
ncbi:MAG: DnaJ domain-containing protein [Bacteroidetes bacterium]|nr:DnaJ domain-containing protein [Bacteroidota bacterium]